MNGSQASRSNLAINYMLEDYVGDVLSGLEAEELDHSLDDVVSILVCYYLKQM
jgi:hypothetical protein